MIKKTVDLLFEKGNVVEMRAIDVPTGNGFVGTFVGWFDDFGKLISEAKKYDSKGAKYVSVSVNPVHRDLLARSYNKLKRVKKGEGTHDKDILSRKWLCIDLDSVRVAGISATDVEKKHAHDKISEVVDLLKSVDFPDPIIADSGNGYHLLYRVDLPNDSTSNAMIDRFYKNISQLMSDDKCTIDSSLSPISKVVRLYGTTARKGDSLPERPHRKSQVISVPAKIELVETSAIESLAVESEPKKTQTSVPNKVFGNFERARAYIDKIPGAIQGQHGDEDTFKVACVCVNDFGLGREESLRLMREFNARCTPMWSEADLINKIESAINSAKQEPLNKANKFKISYNPMAKRRKTDDAPQQPLITNVGNTDMGNAERLINGCGDMIRYSDIQGWYTWTGKIWKHDDLGVRRFYRKYVVQGIKSELNLALQLGEADAVKALKSWARRSENSSVMNSSIAMATSDERVFVSSDEVDMDRDLFCCENGMVDLRTGEISEHSSSKMITRRTSVSYTPEADCPLWLKFLNDIFCGDQELINYIQAAIGYSMTGYTTEQCFFIMYGNGRNGKSVFMNIINLILGTYAMETPAETLMRSRIGSDRPTNDIARLKGARLVSVNETEEGQMLAESKIKALTGDDTIIARFLHKEFFEFKPQFKIWMRTNHKPRIRGMDKGIWRRVHLIPFAMQLKEEDVDKQLQVKLEAEINGIMKWCVDGALIWKNCGLEQPEIVKVATNKYKESQDLIGMFLADRCTVSPDKKTGIITVKELYNEYSEWCEEAGERVQAKRNFNFKLVERGFTKRRGIGNRLVWDGIKIGKADSRSVAR